MSVYTAQIEYTICVQADTTQQAYVLACRHADEEARNQLFDVVDLRKIRRTADIPYGWSNCIPWGADDDTVVYDIIAGDCE